MILIVSALRNIQIINTLFIATICTTLMVVVIDWNIKGIRLSYGSHDDSSGNSSVSPEVDPSSLNISISKTLSATEGS